MSTSFIECSFGCHIRSQTSFPNGVNPHFALQVALPGGSELMDVRIWRYSTTVVGVPGTLTVALWEMVINVSGYAPTVPTIGPGGTASAVLDTPWNDPNLGTMNNDYNGPNENPFRKFVVKLRTSTYDHGAATYSPDGAASVEVDGTVLWSVSGVTISRHRTTPTDRSLRFAYPTWGDLDNVWAANAAITPTYVGAEEIPTHPNIVMFDDFNSGIDLGTWTAFNRTSPPTPVPPVATSLGVNNSGAASTNLAGIEGLLRTFAYALPPITPTTPDPVLVNSVPCCGAPTTPSGSSPGADPPAPWVGPDWTPSCTGGAVVPTAADLVLVESWDY